MRLLNGRFVRSARLFISAAIAVLLSACDPPPTHFASTTNQAPRCSGGEPVSLFISVGQSVVLGCRAVDDDGDAISWTFAFATPLDDITGGAGTLSPREGSGPEARATFTATHRGNVRVALTLTDGKGFGSNSFQIEISPSRDP